MSTASSHNPAVGRSLQSIDAHVAELDAGFRGFKDEMRVTVARIETSISSLTQAVSAGQRSNWPVIWSGVGVAVSILTAIGTLAYLPVTQSIQRIEAQAVRSEERTIALLEKFATGSVTQREFNRHLAEFDRVRDRVLAAPPTH